MALYELMVVIDGQRSEDEIKAQIARIDKIITDGGGEITHSDDWGMRRLAYPIDGQVDGFYTLRQFTHAGRSLDVLTEIEHTVRIEEAILRHMVLRVPKTKVPIPIISRPSSTADSNPDWGQARRGWRPPRPPRDRDFRDRDDRDRDFRDRDDSLPGDKEDDSDE